MNTPFDDFEIAPNFKASKWKTLDIQKGTQWNADWKQALDVFESRINARFINQIDALIENTNEAAERFSGFAIVALDCLLIETLNQFYQGIDETPRRRNKTDEDPHVLAFHNVFQHSAKLKVVFDTKEKTKVFYTHIRCGLLHQAQTKGKSKINRKIKTVIEWCNPENPKDGLTVHPRDFHECVKKICSGYLLLLEAEQSEDLRSKFRAKMNRIAGMK